MSHHRDDINEKNLLQAVINAVPAPIFFKDDEARYLGGNKAFEEYVGLSLDVMVGKTVHELFDKALADVYQAADDALMQSGGNQFYEAQVKYADGTLRDVVFHKAVFHAAQENISGLVGVILDITERKQVERQYQQLAFTDTLTGLSNRLAFQREMDQAFLRNQRSGSPMALLLLDLDNFKAINDSYGHPVGDGFLVEVSKRLAKAARKSDLVVRLGGDEFAILLEDVFDRKKVQVAAAHILEALCGQVETCGLTLPLSTSIGVAMTGEVGITADELMKNADIALYQAKGEGRSRICWFEAEGIESDFFK